MSSLAWFSFMVHPPVEILSGVVGQMRVARDTIEAEGLNLND